MEKMKCEPKRLTGRGKEEGGRRKHEAPEG